MKMATASATTSISKRYAINPTVGIDVGPDTRIDLSYEYFHDRRTADRGVPADGDEPLKGFDSIFFGDPDESYAKADVHVGTLAIEHQFSDGLTLRNRTLYGDYDKFYQNIYPGDLNEGDADGHARRLSKPQRPPEPVQPDRPHLGQPARRASTRRCWSASRSGARNRAISGKTGIVRARRQSSSGSATRRSTPM